MTELKDPNPAAASNNKHHMGGYRSQAEFDEELFGRGAGDPDMIGSYPGENDPNYKPVNKDEPKG